MSTVTYLVNVPFAGLILNTCFIFFLFVVFLVLTFFLYWIRSLTPILQRVRRSDNQRIRIM